MFQSEVTPQFPKSVSQEPRTLPSRGRHEAPGKKKDETASNVTDQVPGLPKKRAPRKKKASTGTLSSMETAENFGEVVNPTGGASILPSKDVKKRGARKKTAGTCTAGSPISEEHKATTPVDANFENNSGNPADGVGSLLSALCDTVMGSSCPESACASTCACGEDVRGEVLNPDSAQAEDATVLPKQEDEPVKIRPRMKRDSKKKWGASVKRGCLAQFTVETFLHLPHVSELTIIQEKHVNCDGLVVHGGMKVGDRSAFSAHLSPEIRAFVEECLRRKDTSNQIMKKHLELLKKYQAEGREITRDLLLTTKDIRNISGKLAQESYMLDKNDAQSVRMWVQRNSDKVFYYTESKKEKPIPVPGELTGENMPFTIGIQTPWQKKMMLQHGHQSGISVDATFGTNEKKVRSILIRTLLCLFSR